MYYSIFFMGKLKFEFVEGLISEAQYYFIAMALFLFDIDGTLTPARGRMDDEMRKFLIMLKMEHKVMLGVVGGSDRAKAVEQLGGGADGIFDYMFSENGMVYYKAGVEIHRKQLKSYIPQVELNMLISEALRYIAELDIPVKTGTFVEMRSGMLNISPIGRNCSAEERAEFTVYNAEHKIVPKMIEHMKRKFVGMKVDYSVGGQISFDVFPTGLNKTFCLEFLGEHKEIHFFGDKTDIGGNDYEIYTDGRVIGHHVDSWPDTLKLCELLVKARKLGDV
ncbi:MAG: hypothetical protein Hyperionvirus7_22 [Hyperionvirus sp.]|uniref:phosphomannomutase n=1 Tax=Hyperionvirus sp. TaxID=2487770 RepID=A0A3G5AB37_9VIRU|nr:MAG: hypothetical protein Hyperionvirus7_22 [Hyperionvirus sp.]